MPLSPRGRGERLVRTLQNPLRSDVNPAPGGHLAVHREAAVLEIAEGFPRGPGRDEQGVGDEDARRAGVRAEDADRFARLHEQRLVVLERAERRDDRVEAAPVARRLAGAAVDDEIVGPFRDVGVEEIGRASCRERV